MIKPGMYISFKWRPRSTVIAKVATVSEKIITTSKRLYTWENNPYMKDATNGYFCSEMADIKILSIEEVQRYLNDSDPDRIYNFSIGDYVILLEDCVSLKKGEIYKTLRYQTSIHSNVIVDHKGSQSYLAPFCSEVRKATDKELHDWICKNSPFKTEEEKETLL